MDGPAPRFPWSVFIALAIALAAVPVALHAAWRSRMVERTQGELLAIADLEARALAAWRAERLEDASRALANPLARRAAQEALAGTGAATGRFGEMLAELTRGDTYSEALLADVQGRVRASATRRQAPLDPATEELAQALREGAPLLSEVCAHGPGDPQHLHVVVPVPDPEGRPAGAIALRLEAETLLLSRVAEWTHSGMGSTLVRRDRDAVLVLGASRGGPHSPGQRLPLDQRRVAPVRAVLGEEGAVEAEDAAGLPVLAALRTVPGTQWHLVVHAGRDATLGSLTRRVWGAAALAALLIGAAGLVVGARFRRQRAVFEAQRAELVSRIHARHVDLLVRHANDVALLLDGDLRILDANDRVLERYGWTPAELRGLHVGVLRADADPGAADEARQRAGGREGGVWEALHRRRDGSTFPVEVSARTFEVDGRTYYQESIRDVSDRKRAGAAVAYQAMLLERLEDAVVGTGPDRRVTFWNRAAERLYGWTAAEASGREVDELLRPELEEAGGVPLERELLERGSATRNARQTARDGRPVHVETTLVALREPGGALTGYVAVSRDLSRLRQVQERLAGAERLAALGALAGGIAHEVNNPLAYLSADVRSAAEALRAHLAAGCDRPGALPDAAAALAEAEAGAQRIAAVVRDLQAFAWAPGEGGGRVDLRAAVRAAAALVHNAVRHRARLELALDEAPLAAADPQALTQALVQILDAVATSIPEGRAEEHQVRVSTRADGGGAALEIGATGPGLDETQLRALLEPGAPAAAPAGLAAAGAALRAAGAGIAAHRPPAGGTSVLLRFPAAPRPGPREAPAAVPAPRRGRILVVDDEPLVGRAVARLLSAEHEVVVEADGRAAAARLEGGDLFDLVLCDLMMPDVTGMELHERLLARRPAAAARMVFMTGGAFTERAREFLDRVRAPCLDKPFDPERLRALVAERLGPSRPA